MKHETRETASSGKELEREIDSIENAREEVLAT